MYDSVPIGAKNMPLASAKSVTELLGVPAAPRTGRERLVGAAIELFYRNGFAAVGIDQVLEEAGVTKTTFYKHFESKDDLMVAAVQRRDEWEQEAWGSRGPENGRRRPGGAGARHV